MRSRALKRVMLLIAGVTLVASLAMLLSSGSPSPSLPTGELSLAHFREVGIPFTQSSFGVREWRYAGDPAVGARPQSFTDFWVGSLEVSTRLPATAVAIPFALAGLSLFGLLVVVTFEGWRRA